MMRWIIGSSLRARRMVVVLAAGILFFGIVQVRAMPVDVLPEFTPPTVEIQIEALGLSAVEVEQLITAPLEQNLLNGVAFLDEIRSESVPGLSSVEMLFEPGTDVEDARQLVQERLINSGALPHVSRAPQMLQPLSSTSRVMMIRLSSQELSLIDLSVLARWTVRPHLMGVPGVANVVVFGQRERQLQVLIDPERLRDQEVSLLQVIETTANAQWVSKLTFVEASTPGTGGFIDTANQRLAIQHILPYRSADDLERVPIEGTDDMLLSDVADVVEDHQPLIGNAVFADGTGLLLVVEKFPGVNTLDVTQGVEDALAALAPGLAGVDIDTTIFRPATFIRTGIDNLATSLVIGSALLILALGAFFFGWRAASIGVVTLLVSLAAGAAILRLRDTTINAMSVAGLVMALAVVIDEAIVSVENIRLRRRTDENVTSPSRILLSATLEARGAMLYATLIILVALAPVFFLRDGEARAFFPPMVLSYALAVVAAMVVALVVTPALCLILLGNERADRTEPAVVRWLQQRYERALSRVVAIPRAAIAAVALITVVGIGVLPFLDQTSRPSFRDTDLLVRFDGASATSLPAMTRITGQASREMLAIPGVLNVGAHVGRAVMSDQVGGINAGELWIDIDAGADYDATVASIQQVVDGYPGLDGEVLTHPEERIDEILGGPADPVTVRIYGQDFEIMRTKAAEVRKVISDVEGVANAAVEPQELEPTLEIEVDLDAAAAYGVKPGDVRRAAATLLSGIEVGSLFEEQKVFEVIVVGTPETRRNVSTVQDLLIGTPSGEYVALSELADVRIAPTPTVIRHESVARSIDITADVSGRDLGDVAADIEQQLQGIEFPLEHHAALLGDYAEHQDAFGRVFWYAAAAAIGVFLLLQACFSSWRLAALAFSLLPGSLAGGLLAVWITDGTLTLGSMAGLFVVFAIAVRSVIMLLRHYRSLEWTEHEPLGSKLVMRGSRERLGPVVMTASAAVLAFLPVLIFGDIAGQEIVYRMAVVVVGGLVTSTLLTLFVAPTLYLRLGAGPDAVDVELTSMMQEDDLVDLTKHEAAQRAKALSDEGARDAAG